MTIKDIEQMREEALASYYLEEYTAECTHYIYFKSLEALKEYVRKNYTQELRHKEQNGKIISGVKIWRN